MISIVQSQLFLFARFKKIDFLKKPTDVLFPLPYYLIQYDKDLAFDIKSDEDRISWLCLFDRAEALSKLLPVFPLQRSLTYQKTDRSVKRKTQKTSISASGENIVT